MNKERKVELWETIHRTLIEKGVTNGEVLELFGKQIFWCMRLSNYSKIQSLTEQNSKMKTEQEIRSILTSHSLNARKILEDPELLKTLAVGQNWTEEYFKGYIAGVQFAYAFVLGDMV